MSFELVRVSTSEEWAAYHRIRKAELWDARGRTSPAYNPDYPDEYKSNHTPLMLKVNGVAVGTLRLDDLGHGRFCTRLVAIEKSRQGQGLGRWMLEQTVTLAQAKGAKELVVNADEDAVGYYQACGFHEEVWDEGERKSPMAAGCVQMVRVL